MNRSVSREREGIVGPHVGCWVVTTDETRALDDGGGPIATRVVRTSDEKEAPIGDDKFFFAARGSIHVAIPIQGVLCNVRAKCVDIDEVRPRPAIR